MISLSKEMFTVMEQMTAKLDTVKDKDSAAAAAPEMRKLTDKLFDIQSRIGTATPPTPDKAQEAMALQGKAQEVTKKYAEAATRVAQAGLMTPELAQSMQPKQPEAPKAE